MKSNTKNIIKALAIVMSLATATTEGFAQTKASGKVSSTKASTLDVRDMGNLRFKVAFDNPLKQKAKISLLDKENETYFYDYTMSDAQYIKAFNLSNLADGTYTFVVQTPKERLTKEFVIKTQTFRGISLASNN